MGKGRGEGGEEGGSFSPLLPPPCYARDGKGKGGRRGEKTNTVFHMIKS
jgi:hypothetical protein